MSQEKYDPPVDQVLGQSQKMSDPVPYLGALVSSRQPDMVNHPPHYTSHPSGIECIDITRHMDFLLGNALKYIWRSDRKGKKLEDLNKAKWYIEQAIDKETILDRMTEEGMEKC